MVRHGWRAAVLAGLLLGTSWTASALGISKDFDQKYPLQPGGTFELQNVNGTVDVQGWDRNEVEVRAVKTAKQRESDLERVSIDVDARPNAISVSTRYPQNEGVEVAVEYTIHVPHGASVEHLATVNGTLRISDVDNVEELRTVNGNIEVFEGGGAVRAHTTNGNIHIELPRRQARDVVAETMNGSVIMALPADAQADLETRCLNGNFSSEIPISMESTAAPREMRGRLGAGGAVIRLRTVNGAIRIVSYRSTV